MGKRIRIWLMAAVLVLLSAAMSLAQGAGGYVIPWDAFAGGGDRMASTHFSLAGSAGEPAGEASTSSHYLLSAGFWAGMDFARSLFLPLVRR